MSLALISCIIPVFNGELYVGEAIDSIFAQSYTRLEVIVIDDGSTDRTAEVVGAFGNRVRCLRQENSGPAAARNFGISAARGEFIAFLDADDLWHPEKLERQMARFHAQPNLQFCVTYAQNFCVSEMRAEAARYDSHRIAQPLPAYVTQTLLARRAVFERVGMFDTTLAHGDSAAWFLRAEDLGVVGEILSDVLMYRRLHRDNRSRVLAGESREEFLHIVKTSLDRKRHKRSG